MGNNQSNENKKPFRWCEYKSYEIEEKFDNNNNN